MMKTRQKKHVLENLHMTEELEKILSNLSDAGCGKRGTEESSSKDAVPFDKLQDFFGKYLQ